MMKGLTLRLEKIAGALSGYVRDNRGVTAIEYAIIAVAISAIVIAVFNGDSGIQGALDSALGTISSNIQSAGGTTQ
ncbi:Flp family type IVb pilin [Parasalinivibrio latis]|uniref:Flp family type IVb pilin n=1 Tax=Parasalinivibrio latis TaxID=2952610 RepID=UPI0030E19B02